MRAKLHDLKVRALQLNRKVEDWSARNLPVGLAMAVALLWPRSFSVDLTGLLGYAEDIFNGLLPAFLPVIGIVLGIGLVLLIVSSISKAIKMKA